jgi:hypothetical protein
MKEVYQNRNGDKAPIFIISQFRRFIKANSKMTLGQQSGAKNFSPAQQKRNILSNIGNMFMGKQKIDIENGQIIAESNRGKSAKTPQNLQFTGKKPLDNETIL